MSFCRCRMPVQPWNQHGAGERFASTISSRRSRLSVAVNASARLRCCISAGTAGPATDLSSFPQIHETGERSRPGTLGGGRDPAHLTVLSAIEPSDSHALAGIPRTNLRQRSARMNSWIRPRGTTGAHKQPGISMGNESALLHPTIAHSIPHYIEIPKRFQTITP